MTGSLVSHTLFSCRDAKCTDRSSIFCIVCGYQVLLPEYVECGTMDADGFSIVDNRVQASRLELNYMCHGMRRRWRWISQSTGTVPLRNVPDVFGMIGRRDSVTESHILQGRDACNIRVLVPDCRGLDQNFHDVTVVDNGDLPESHVSIPELSRNWHTNGDSRSWRRCARRPGCNTGRNSRRRVSFVAL